MPEHEEAQWVDIEDVDVSAESLGTVPKTDAADSTAEHIDLVTMADHFEANWEIDSA